MQFDGADEAALQAFVEGGAFDESHHLEAKREVGDGPRANLELARDLASLAVDGGLLIVGVAEDKSTSSFRLGPLALMGLAERVEQVADSRVNPRLVLRFRNIASADNFEIGYLVVEVPPSPEAPHMVDGRYYGRGDITKHVLSGAEVRRLGERRTQRRNDFEARLAQDVVADPTPEDARHEAHLFILAAPSTGRPEMLHNAASRQGMSLHRWASTHVLHGLPTQPLFWPFDADFNPDVKAGLEIATRARGVGLHTWAMGANRVPQSTTDNGPIKERQLLDVEIDDDGTIHLFCAAGTVTHNGQRLMVPPLVAGLTTESFAPPPRLAPPSRTRGAGTSVCT